MTFLKTTGFTALSCLILSACATTPDPAKICTSEWIGARSDRALSRIETRSASSLKSLKRASRSWAAGKTPGPFQLLALSNSIGKLKKELTNGAGIKDLRTLASTCNDPEIISTAMRDLLGRQELPERFQSMIEQSPIFENLLQELSAGIASSGAEKPTSENSTS